MSHIFRIAIVGTGPSGMYALEHLLHNKAISVEIDLFERLPVPWGLVRYGVAPDHPEKKLIANRLYNNLISRNNVRFFGNITIGEDIKHEELTQWYDGVIYASGATSDNKMNIPGEDLAGSWSAREFVAWYNGHPDYSQLTFDFSAERAVIVGNGNVALDVARILLLPINELKQTDIAHHAIEALSKSNIKEVVLVGPRGYQNGAYNNPELEELLHLDDVDVQVEDPDFKNISESDFTQFDWETQRKIITLKQLVKQSTGKASKRIIFKFLASPSKVLGSEKVEQLTFTHNQRTIDATGKQTILATDKESSLDTGLIFRAIGYRGQPFKGLPFDANRNVIENSRGRITDNGEIVKGAYVTGWIKRGPQGVIGTNKQCSGETVSCLLADLTNSPSNISQSTTADWILQEINTRTEDVVSLDGWLKIDRAEKENGAIQQRPRLKLCEVDQMLKVAQA